MTGALRYLLLLWWVPALVLLWLKGQSVLMIQRLTVDLTASGGVPPYTGMLSNLGIALWLITGSLLVFSAYHTEGEERGERPTLWIVGLLSLWLGLDDGLMFHEDVIPGLLGVDDRLIQPVLYSLYAGVLAWGLRYHRPRMKEAHFLVFLAALGCLGGSVGLDLLKDGHWIPARHPLMLDEGLFMWWEDGLKLMGIVAWSGYWIRQGSQALRRSRSGPSD